MESQPQALEQIQERLLKLERQNRRFKQVGAVGLIVMASIILIAQAPPRKALEANEITLRDSKGNVRIKLAMAGKDETPEITLFDASGKERIGLEAGWGAGLKLSDPQGRHRGGFIADSFGLGSSLLLLDEKGNTKTHLNEASVSAPEVTSNEFDLHDDNAKLRARLFMAEKHTGNITLPGMEKPVPMTFNPSPMLALYDEKGNARVLLNGTGDVYGSNFAISDSEGKQLGSFLGVDGYGAMLGIYNGKGDLRAILTPGNLELTDDDGFKSAMGVEKNLVTPRTGETHQTSAASVLLFSRDGNVIWRAP